MHGAFYFGIAFWLFMAVAAVAGIVADYKKRQLELEPLRAAIERLAAATRDQRVAESSAHGAVARVDRDRLARNRAGQRLRAACHRCGTRHGGDRAIPSAHELRQARRHWARRDCELSGVARRVTRLLFRCGAEHGLAHETHHDALRSPRAVT